MYRSPGRARGSCRTAAWKQPDRLPPCITSGYRIDRLFRVPHVEQRAHFNAGQLWTSFQPGFNSCALLCADRTALLQAHQTVVVAANITKAVGFHGFFQERFEESVDSFFRQVFFEIQVQLKTQLLKFINAQLFAQTLGTISSH